MKLPTTRRYAAPVVMAILLAGCSESPAGLPTEAEARAPFGPSGEVRAPVYLSQIGPEAFSSSTVIDFETGPEALIEDFYGDLGVTMADLAIPAGTYDTGTGEGKSRVACNFDFAGELSGVPPGELRFDPAVARAGFHVTTEEPDDVTVTAYLEGTPVGAELFDTGGGGFGGSFAGVEFDSPFDRLVIDAENELVGAFCIDNLRFEAPEATEGPETVAEALSDLRTLIGELRDEGVLARGQANALARRLEVAQRLMARGNVRAALNVLDAFVHHARALAAEGVLAPAQADDLIALATTAQELMTG